MRTRTLVLLVTAGVALLPPIALSDAANGERDALARLAYELEALEPLIEEAEAQSDPDARVEFRYDWLRRDLERVRHGIQEHIEAPRQPQPRQIDPLQGDYRR
ncbi:RAQPRD family integrative conjugative element protein [Halorhodospira halophila]|uniref:integrative conjugative element protein, RAQPRD family n=1 Tax=Halorhodospira halophila TaxID=1053 RepID=UPI0019147FF2|nr:RAQPRD family integrative conjugative element protein [Halorhodospira halophila]MBK5944838.1 conjugal transfer protein [Halorhodospira halophila]